MNSVNELVEELLLSGLVTINSEDRDTHVINTSRKEKLSINIDKQKLLDLSDLFYG